MLLVQQRWLAIFIASFIALQAHGSSLSRSSLAKLSAPAPVATRQDGEVTRSNWQQHPKIKKVRAIVEAINAGMTKGAYKISRREFEFCEPYEDGERKMAVDGAGRVRFYEHAGGSEDSSLKWEHYYDETGRLRFVYITGGAANGTELEHRIYFDEGGKRIWEEQKYVKGPGYTFPEVWPEEQLQINDPAKAFNTASKCPESKPQDKKQKS